MSPFCGGNLSVPLKVQKACTFKAGSSILENLVSRNNHTPVYKTTHIKVRIHHNSNHHRQPKYTSQVLDTLFNEEVSVQMSRIG